MNYNIVLDTEQEFLLKLIELVNDDTITIKKTLYKYCNVDYKLEDSKKKKLYIELKSRKNILKYDTLFIGYTKLQSIKIKYKDCLLVWSGDDYIFWCKYTDDLLKYTVVNICGSNCYEIPKTIMNNDINDLINFIHQYYHK